MLDKPRSRTPGLSNAFVKNDEMERFRLLRMLANWLVPRYRLKWPQMGWWDDSFFNAYLEQFSEERGLNADRRFMLYQLSRLSIAVDGDTAECGAYLGAGSFLMVLINREAPSNRKHVIFDSFEGLSTPKQIDGAHWIEGDLSVSEAQMRENLSEFESEIEVHKGWIPDSFRSVSERRYAFVHIDVDLYQPTLDSIDYFYPRLSKNAILLCDDYGLKFCPGATAAMDEFFSDKPEKVLSLSGGSGFIVKGMPTATVVSHMP